MRDRRQGGRFAAACAACAMVAATGVGPGATGRVAAQEIPPPSFVLTAGLFDRDYQGDDTETAFGVRVRFPLGTYVLIEPGIMRSAFTDMEMEEDEVAEEDMTLYLLDFQVQAQLPLGRFRPFVGVGAGGAFDPREERGVDDFVLSTYTISGGVAAELGRGLDALAEVRYRGLDGFEHDNVHLSLGLGWRP